MPLIVIAIVVFILFYTFIFSKSENKRKNNHKKYVSMVKNKENLSKPNLDDFLER